MGFGVPGLPIVCLHLRRRTRKTSLCGSFLDSWQQLCFPICAFAALEIHELKLAGIKTGLGLSKSKLDELRRAVDEEVE